MEKSKLNSEKIWKYGRKVSWKVKIYGKYRGKLWKDMESMEERQVESWKDMESMEENREKIWKIQMKIVKTYEKYGRK